MHLPACSSRDLWIADRSCTAEVSKDRCTCQLRLAKNLVQNYSSVLLHEAERMGQVLVVQNQPPCTPAVPPRREFSDRLAVGNSILF